MTTETGPTPAAWDRDSLPQGEEKVEAVRQMFDAIAPRYDLVNRLMTFRLDVRWRRLAVRSLELSPGAVHADRSGAPRAQADILRLPFPDASLDGVTCGFALRNLVDLGVFFGELGRAVRPGGRI